MRGRTFLLGKKEYKVKKLMLLGGSAQQLIAIKTARRLGYDTVLCDYLGDNPGQYIADRFYLVSTTDKEAVLNVAKEEGINGIIAYASDPAAPTAAYVAENMGLPTNPYASVEILCSKDKFRTFLEQNGFNSPAAKSYSSIEKALKDKGNFRLPVIVKPVDSSGSKGVAVLQGCYGWEEALSSAFSYSRSHQVIIEEFIEKKYSYLIGGDIFVADGQVILWGLMNCHRDSTVNPLVPVGKSYPVDIDKADLKAVKRTLQSMVDKLGIRFGEMNVELVIDESGCVWPIDVGPRAGGNMIPDLLSLIFNVDIVEMSVKAAMADKFLTEVQKGIPFYATHNLHSGKTGLYESISFSDEIEKHIVKKCFYKKRGDLAECFCDASKALGIIFLKYSDMREMKNMLDNINCHIKVNLGER